MHTHFPMRSCSRGRQTSFPLTSDSSKSTYQQFGQKEFNLLFKSRQFNYTHFFNFYLSSALHAFVIVYSCPSNGFPRKSIHLNACETDRAHHQLTEMMEINNMQFIQINGCDGTELMAGANKRPLQVDNDYCSDEL